MRDPNLILAHLGATIALHARLVQAQLFAVDQLFAELRPLGCTGVAEYQAFARCAEHAEHLEGEVDRLVDELAQVHVVRAKKTQN